MCVFFVWWMFFASIPILNSWTTKNTGKHNPLLISWDSMFKWNNQGLSTWQGANVGRGFHMSSLCAFVLSTHYFGLMFTTFIPTSTKISTHVSFIQVLPNSISLAFLDQSTAGKIAQTCSRNDWTFESLEWKKEWIQSYSGKKKCIIYIAESSMKPGIHKW